MRKCSIFALSEMPANSKESARTQFFTDRFRRENSLGTNIEHVQSRCMADGARRPSFLAIFCLSARAHLLVHVRCPLITFSWQILKMQKSERWWYHDLFSSSFDHKEKCALMTRKSHDQIALTPALLPTIALADKTGTFKTSACPQSV